MRTENLKNVNKALLILVFILSLTALFACGGENEKTYRVMVSYGEGVEILSENPIEVRMGGTASFSL